MRPACSALCLQTTSDHACLFCDAVEEMFAVRVSPSSAVVELLLCYVVSCRFRTGGLACRGSSTTFEYVAHALWRTCV